MNEEKKIIEEKRVEKIYENLLIIYSFLVMWDTKETKMIQKCMAISFFHGYKINIFSLMKPIESNMNLRQNNRTEASFPYWHKSKFLGNEWSGIETRAQSKSCKIILEYFINSFPLLT